MIDEIRKSVTVVIPMFNEQDNVNALCDRLERVIAEHGRYHWELIFVDDGSRDRTVDRLKARQERGLPMTIIRFTRNFGHQAAIKAGLDHANADAVITMDGDGQHPPELISRLLALWQEGNHVVQTVRSQTQTSSNPVKRTLVRWAYAAINCFAERPVPPECADFRLIDRKVLDELKRMPETDPMLRGLVAWVGFRQTTLEYQVQNRTVGQSRFSFRQLLNLLVSGIFDLSYRPLILPTLLGAILLGVSLIGWLVGAMASITTFILLLAALQLLGLGLIGAYLGRAYRQTLDRPLYIVDETVNFTEKYFDTFLSRPENND